MLTTFATRLSLTASLPIVMNLECPEEPPPNGPPAVEKIAAGIDHTCAVALDGARLRCWGLNDRGQLGQGSTEDIGDDEPASLATDVALVGFGRVVELAAGIVHTCARSDTGRVRCWGDRELLGLEASEDIGDDEAVPNQDIDLGFVDGDPQKPQTALAIAAATRWTCALLADNTARCWGLNDTGGLGLGFESDPIGDDEPVADAPPVPVGALLRGIDAGTSHVCGLTSTNRVRCWGHNNDGQLGYGHTQRIGDDDTPADAGDVDLGGDKVVELTVGGAHACVRTLEDKVRCWGFNAYGQLGYGHTESVGDDELPASAGYVQVDKTRSVVQLAAGTVHTCAVLDDGNVKCWGYGQEGQLGHGDTKSIGDNETPASAPDVKIGGQVERLTLGEHACALLTTRDVRCWGINYSGQLGYGHTQLVGDNEPPKSAGNVAIF